MKVDLSEFTAGPAARPPSLPYLPTLPQNSTITMVTTTLVSPNTIKPKLRRSIPFGAPHTYAYGYEKLSNENESESQSLIGSISLCDSICARHCAPHDVDAPVADNFTSGGSISSVLFSVDNQSRERDSSDECSYSYSLCSNSLLSEGHPSLTSIVKQKRENNTLDTSDYSNWSFVVSFMSRHAGLDYNGRTFPQDATSTSARAVTSHNDMPNQSLQTTDEDLSGDVRTTTKDYCDTNVATTLRHQLETTLSSESDDLSTSTQYDLTVRLIPKGGTTNEHKVARIRKWLSKLNPTSSLVRSMNSPAA